MLIPTEDAPHVRAWLLKKLPEVSDTETDILADYILALLSTIENVSDEVKTNIETELSDVLELDKTPDLVDEILRVIQHKSYLPGAPPPPPKDAHASGKLEAYPSTSDLRNTSQNWNRSKKRSFNDSIGEHAAGGQGFADGRVFKQPRRNGATSGSGGGMAPPNAPTGPSNSQMNMFDPTAASFQPSFGGSFNPPQGPQFSASAPARPYGAPQGHSVSRKPCRDFQTKGYCARGQGCKFDHGSQPITLQPQGSSNGVGNVQEDQLREMVQMMLTHTSQQMQELMDVFNQTTRGGGRGGRGGRGGSSGPRRKRKASISADGPVHDRSKSTIIVENIPQEKLNEQDIRGFFSEFGEILELSLQPHRRLAVVKYETWDSANAAYRSPKVIFDNRFVRVFWQHTAENAQGKDGMDGFEKEPEIDLEEFMKKQEEAQKRHDENMQKKAEIDRQREEIEQKQRDLLARQREVRQKLHAKLSNGEGASTGSTSTSDALRAQLAALEEEAKLLGLDPDADDASVYGGEFRGHGRGRGRGRGRAFYAPRGRGSFRGRGGGGRGDIHAAYATYSLDNRPRVVSIAGADFTAPDKDESLRQHLLGVGEFMSIETTPASTQITFKDRKTAEKFYYGIALAQGSIPGVEGKLELGWVAKPVPHIAAPVAGDAVKREVDEDATMVNVPAAPVTDTSDRDTKFDMDYEQAEEGEWGIE